MAEVRVCFEVSGLAEDKNGNPCPCGLQITIGETEREIDYAELVENISLSAVADLLPGNVKPEDLTVITPEEYDAKYAGEGE